MPAGWPASTAPLSRQAQDHILHGVPKQRKGGHLYGSGVVGKTEFPETWDGERIVRSIGDVMNSPDWVRQAKSDHGTWYFGKEVGGVQIQVAAYKRDGRYYVDRAYLAGGAGVIKNTKNGRIPAVVNRDKLWRQGGRKWTIRLISSRTWLSSPSKW